MSVLKKLYDEDVAEKLAIDWNIVTPESLKQVKKNDQQRRQKVLKLHTVGKIKTALDYHHAALIMQHGETTEDFRLAHEFAEEAVSMGDGSARWLYAATFDRWLLSSGRAQKYGTQFKEVSKGKWELAEPIDPTVTDENRANYNVPPLKDALRRYKEKYNLK